MLRFGWPRGPRAHTRLDWCQQKQHALFAPMFRGYFDDFGVGVFAKGRAGQFSTVEHWRRLHRSGPTERVDRVAVGGCGARPAGPAGAGGVRDRACVQGGAWQLRGIKLLGFFVVFPFKPRRKRAPSKSTRPSRQPLTISVLFGCFARKIDGLSRSFGRLAGPPDLPGTQ